MSLCLAAAGVIVALNADAATLSWQHSVEKTLWEEDWRRSGQDIIITEARVQGSGAGIDPPHEARLINGAWRWRPHITRTREIVMRRSGATADWRICIRGACKPMDALLPAGADPVTLRVC
jgi:hypothetical protein